MALAQSALAAAAANEVSLGCTNLPAAFFIAVYESLFCSA